MTFLRVVGVCVGLFSLSAVAAENSLNLSPEECAVWSREISFAQSVDHHDAKAFAAHVQSGAVFNAASDAPIHGREDIVKSWAGIIAGKDIKLVWRPHYVSIGGNPNIALSRGPFMIENSAPGAKHRYLVGQFTSVWARTGAKAPWLVIFDGGGPPPTPVASEAEAQSHVTSTPDICPGG